MKRFFRWAKRQWQRRKKYKQLVCEVVDLLENIPGLKARDIVHKYLAYQLLCDQEAAQLGKLRERYEEAKHQLEAMQQRLEDELQARSDALEIQRDLWEKWLDEKGGLLSLNRINDYVRKMEQDAAFTQSMGWDVRSEMVRLALGYLADDLERKLKGEDDGDTDTG